MMGESILIAGGGGVRGQPKLLQIKDLLVMIDVLTIRVVLE